MGYESEKTLDGHGDAPFSWEKNPHPVLYQLIQPDRKIKHWTEMAPNRCRRWWQFWKPRFTKVYCSSVFDTEEPVDKGNVITYKQQCHDFIDQSSEALCKTIWQMLHERG